MPEQSGVLYRMTKYQVCCYNTKPLPRNLACLLRAEYIGTAAMLSQLGSFYQKNGARARMNKDTGNSLLNKLQAAEASLTPAETKKKGIFG